MDKRVEALKNWIEREGRVQKWVAQQDGCSPQWLNYVLKGKKPLSDKLAQTLQDKLGIALIVEKIELHRDQEKVQLTSGNEKGTTLADSL